MLADPDAEAATNFLKTDRAQYIKAANRCQQWAAVLRLMDQFKDDVNLTVFGSKAVYDFTRKQAQQQLAKSPT